jgi:RimJ/RimL family protein N-acetyltransferase
VIFLRNRTLDIFHGGHAEYARRKCTIFPIAGEMKALDYSFGVFELCKRQAITTPGEWGSRTRLRTQVSNGQQKFDSSGYWHRTILAQYYGHVWIQVQPEGQADFTLFNY